MSSSPQLSQEVIKESNQRQETTLRNIQNLQEMEKSLYSQLEASSANGGDNHVQLVKKINELSQMRVSMFEELDSMYKGVQGRVMQSRNDLVDQMIVTNVVENELNATKKSLNALKNNENSKMRMVEINTYYSKQYRAQTDVMKLVILTSGILFILIVLSKKGFVPSNIASGLIAITCVVGGFFVVRKIFDINSRSNMNFDEYEWSWNPAAVKPTVIKYDEAQLLGAATSLKDDAHSFAKDIGIGCVGESCCSSDMTFDKKTEKCVVAHDSHASKEGFSNNIEYMEDRTPISPWTEKQTTVIPFNNSKDNYVRF
jgi:hypothetical protein